VKSIPFGQYRLDLTNECLWQDTRAIPLRPKAFAVLKILIEKSGQLVKTQEVLDSVWPGTFVGDAVLKGCILQLREALKDSAASPRYIETVHRRGYRFIGGAGEAAEDDSCGASARRESIPVQDGSSCTVEHAPGEIQVGVLGRDAELTKLLEWLEHVSRGERETVFVTGEAGIGKTTLVEAFLEQARQVAGALVVRGQCLEHFGSGEAYLPVLDGFSRLCRSAEGVRALEILREQAPSWLAHMSWLAAPAERESLQSRTMGTRERMLREMAGAIERLSDQYPVLLVLEDLHWSDYSTLDLIAHLARRRDPACLMIIGTYRPVDVILTGHPLKDVKRELQAHRLCHELPLEYLTEDAVTQYLAARCRHHELPSRLRHSIYRRTEGNPLFMVSLVEYLIEEKFIEEETGTWKLQRELTEIEAAVPSSVKELIEKQMERLSSDERRVLEAASATGMEFSIVAVAAGLEMPTDWVERHCEELARRHQFLTSGWLGELPDGSISPRHRFRHVLYREVPYSLIAPMRRAQIHQRIAERAVEIFREHANEIAAELAMHFEQSRDWPRALEYLVEAARTAYQRSAHHEAARLAGRGLEILASLPETGERAGLEITLRMIQSVSWIAVKGFAAVEMERIRALAKELSWLNGRSPQMFNMLVLLLLYYKFSGQLESAEEAARELMEIAQALGDPALVMEAERAMGSAMLEQGKCREALEHFNRASSLYAEHNNHPYTLTIAHDCKVVSECFAARALWRLGDAEGALKRMDEALAFARELSHPASWIFAAHFCAQLHQLRGDAVAAHERAQEVVKLADEFGLDLWQALGDIDLGWAEAELGSREDGIERLQRGIKRYMATGAKLWCPHFLGLLADQLGKAKRVEEGVETIRKALHLTETSREYYPAPELQRIEHELVGKKSRQTGHSEGKESLLAPVAGA
jgi:DNA-binding winged helix-turn-helix (wHTH) protein/tetratricopeptide (TPR) repeat protein